jgi:hypothetical protein
MTLKEKALEYFDSEMAGTGVVASDGMWFGEKAVFEFAAEFTAQELESGDYILKADVVKMITELQAEVITESQDYHVRIAKLSVLSILKNQIKK